MARGTGGAWGVFPFGQLFRHPGVGVLLGKRFRVAICVRGEVDMSYLGRSGSAAGEGQTLFSSGGGGAGGALS